MTDNDVIELKRFINTLGAVLGNAVDKLGGENCDDMSRSVMLDMIQFLMFLGASDNEITWEETDLINRISDIPWTPGLIGKYIRDKDIYSVRFEKTVPPTFGMLIGVEGIINNLSNTNINLSENMLNIYRLLGKDFLRISNENKTATENYRSYISMMEEYLAEHNKESNESAKGFTKTGSKDISTVEDVKVQPVVASKDDDLGVEAPKKG